MPDFYTDRGLAVFLNGHDFSQASIEIVSDIEVNAALDFPHFDEPCLADGFDEVELRFRPRDGLPNGRYGDYSADNRIIRIADINPCLANTSFGHELGHMFQVYCINLLDYKHEASEFWARNQIANGRAREILCPQGGSISETTN